VTDVTEALRDGRFVIVGSLGEGAQGHTYDGVDKREGRAVAIKRFDVRFAKTWKDAELAEREARVLQSLSHPRLPKYIDHFEQGGALYLVMEKIEGESLASLQKRGELLSEQDIVRFFHDASEVLDYLHRRVPPVIHRDLKPGNVIRRPDGSFAFVDFGAVRDKLRPEGGSTIVGTFGYMAPEQFQGRALPASDVYAIGATALSMLTGRQPEDLPHKGLAIDVRAALGDRGSARLADALTLMLDPDPDRRAPGLAPVLAQLEGGSRGRAQGHARAEEAMRSVISDRLEQQAEEYEARAREYEAHAAAGGRGARGWRRGAEGWHQGARKLREAAKRHLLREVREADERARRGARKEARRAGRAARRQATGSRRPPWPVALLFSIVFALGMVAIAIATQVIVPGLLRLLSLFFATRGLTAAANAVREAGEDAMSGMDRSRQWFRGTEAKSEAVGDEQVRVAAGDGPKVRVEADPADTDYDADADVREEKQQGGNEGRS
jgi:tRNA A-37 threonylcarbamoyl transferase component Bud32